MSSQQILNKLIGMFSQISAYSLANYIINEKQWKIIQKTCQQLLKSPLHIHDKPNISIDHIEYLSKLWIQENKKIKLIIIDYLQLINIDSIFNVNRVQELSHITRKLKLLAQYLNIPVITLSQLNRSIELRTNKKPILSDLKESGCISTRIKVHINQYKQNLIYINSLFKIQNWEYIPIIYSSKNNYLHHQKLSKICYTVKHLFINKLYKNKRLNLTDNHKSLFNHKWIKNNKILDDQMIETNFIHRRNNKLIEYKYIENINYVKYSYTYDITMINYFNFICNNVIIHNSIEQDADIIMMLYEKNQNHPELNANKEKLIDITLSKNRNGPTGSCLLKFSLETTMFRETNQNLI